MTTEFLTMSQKIELFDRIKAGDIDALEIIVRELDRLENSVRNCELAMSQVVKQMNNTSIKKPKL